LNIYDWDGASKFLGVFEEEKNGIKVSLVYFGRQERESG